MCELPALHAPRVHDFGNSSTFMTYYTPDSYGSFNLSKPYKLLLDLSDSPIQSDLKSDYSPCEICLNSTPILMLTCAYCNASVHSICYGTSEYSDPWVCERCINKLIGKQVSSCRICDIGRGALKKLKNNEWVHIGCVE